MSDTEPDFPIAIRNSLIDSDELYGFKHNRRALLTNGSLEVFTQQQLKDYERMAVFGAFVVGAKESEPFLAFSEYAENSGESLVSILNTGQIGLEALHGASPRKLCADLGKKGIVSLNAGYLARELLGNPADNHSVILAAAVEVYENPQDSSLLPAFSFNRELKDLVYRARTNLPSGLHESGYPEVRQILDATEQTKDDLAIEAAIDLLPPDVDEYYRV
jgi:hypothetical protein